MSCCLQQKLIKHNGDGVHKKLHVGLYQIDSLFFIPKQKIRHGLAKNSIIMSSCVNNVQHYLSHLYTWKMTILRNTAA